jgi:hypothetical protein
MFSTGRICSREQRKSNLIGWRETLTTSPPNHIHFYLVRAKKRTPSGKRALSVKYSSYILVTQTNSPKYVFFNMGRFHDLRLCVLVYEPFMELTANEMRSMVVTVQPVLSVRFTSFFQTVSREKFSFLLVYSS